MAVLLLFAFISGLVTILAPCIWPLLPIIFSASATGGRAKSLGISLGIVISFAIFTLTLSYLVSIFKFDPDILRTFAVIILTFLGLSLIIPALTGRLEVLFSKLSGLIQVKTGNQRGGFWPGLLTGFSLGVVWSPCAGPILSTIATLSATRAVNFGIVLVTLSYITGVFVVLMLFSLGGNTILTRSKLLSKYTAAIQRVFGIVIILTAFSIYTNYDKVLQVKLLDAIPAYSTFIYKLETVEPVDRALQDLKKGKEDMDFNANLKKPFNQISDMKGTKLPVLGKAPEFSGIVHWLNTDHPLTMAELRGKVVLIDFWTYTCINCIRTLPHVTGWYEKYKDSNFVVVGVHTPEFEFEKKTENVQMAIKQYKINYPVAQDNDYRTWEAYNNRYWPAKYLIDREGNLRKYHFGEGAYEEMEAAIRELIAEAGGVVMEDKDVLPDKTPRTRLTPESYLGFERMDRFYANEEIALGEKSYSMKPGLPLHHLTFEGKWLVEREFSQTVESANIYLNFSATKVFLVMHPGGSEDKVKVYLDGDEVATIDVVEPKLYEMIDLAGKNGEHLLKLEFLNPGTKVFAFTFG